MVTLHAPSERSDQTAQTCSGLTMHYLFCPEDQTKRNPHANSADPHESAGSTLFAIPFSSLY